MAVGATGLVPRKKDLLLGSFLCAGWFVATCFLRGERGG